MSKWKIYHNSKCSKSRQVLSLLKENGIDPVVIEYLKTPPSKEELREIIAALSEGMASSLVRVKEDKYKELKFDLNSEDEIVNQLSKHPDLLERPIVLYNGNALIGRPPENVLKLLK